MAVVVGIARFEYRVQQLLLGLEMVQQTGRGHPGLTRDLAQRRGTPPVAREQPLRDGEDPLPPVLSLGVQRGVRALTGHRTPLFNRPTERTLGRFDWRDKSLAGQTPRIAHNPSDLAMITFITSLVPA